MVKFIYNFCLLALLFFSLPALVWNFFAHRKYRRSFAQKLGFKLPDISIPQESFRIWIHAVSMGETKAVAPLVRLIEQKNPQATLVFSSTTETGHDEAKRSFPGLAGYFFLPFDFSWVMKRIEKKLKPDLLILVEGEFWYNLVHLAKTVVLVNGKLSDRSYRRFKKMSFFSKRLFSRFSLLCLQSPRYVSSFVSLGVDPEKIIVTGNLKFDQPFPDIDIEKWKKELGITEKDRVITIGSTHASEESLLLDAIESLFHTFPTLKILLVPRHPERFDAVAELLKRKGVVFSRFSDHALKKGNGRVILIDTMGILNACYRISELAIVGGSFVSHVGGHNIFEPAALGVPVLFGPHMSSQKDLVETIVAACAGQQVVLQELPHVLLQYLNHPPVQMRQAGLGLAKEVHGSTERTWEAIKTKIWQKD